jgi:ACS family tartrate transporter-like MFS transporter
MAVAPGRGLSAGSELEQAIGRKVVRRLVLPCAPFILIGAIDRTNVGFAALQMNADLGLSASQYGFGAGILFLGYVIAKYPSVLLYEAWGLRRWLAFITFGWGLAAAALAAIQTADQLFVLRFLIGFLEGGLSSGLMLYLSGWAPDRWKATILALPIMSVNISQVIGGPAAGVLMDMDNPFGMAGWRFMFLVEALPALGLAVFALFYFPDSPERVKWLSGAEKGWLAANVKGPVKPVTEADRAARWAILKSPMGWTCALIWYCILASNYGMIYWLPTIVSGLSGLSATQTGLVIALPNIASAIGLVLNARHSDKTGERPFHVAVPALVGGCGLLGAYFLGAGLPGLLLLIVGAGCTGCTVAAFWAIPMKVIPPQSLAMGVVMINMFGSFAGATVPYAMGWLAETTGSYLAPTLLILAIAVTCASLCVVVRRQLRDL